MVPFHILHCILWSVKQSLYFIIIKRSLWNQKRCSSAIAQPCLWSIDDLSTHTIIFLSVHCRQPSSRWTALITLLCTTLQVSLLVFKLRNLWSNLFDKPCISLFSTNHSDLSSRPCCSVAEHMRALCSAVKAVSLFSVPNLQKKIEQSFQLTFDQERLFVLK